MLSIGAMGKASQRTADYYLNLAKEDYYTAGGEPPGRWQGAGAARLGLSSPVEGATLRGVLAGYDPRNGEGLVQNAGNGHVVGWDLTFSAPKSVSVLWSQADPKIRQTIQAAQQAAVDRTLAFIQAQAAFTRRGPGSTVQEPVAGLLVAAFEHATSREQDPQLHTHCLMANIAPRHDGSWGALDSRQLYRWKMAAGAVYRAELANALQSRLQLGVTRDGRSFRVHGVPRAVEQHFSKRAGQIQAHLHSLGLTSAKAAAVAALESRERKAQIDRPALLQGWQREGRALGFGPAEVAAFLSVPPPPRKAIEPPTPEGLLENLTETASTFTERDIWRAAAEASQGVSGYAGVAGRVEEILDGPELVRLGIDPKGDRRYSTRTMVALERAMVEAASERQGEGKHRVTDDHFDAALKTRTLSPEQTQAVRHLTRGADAVACVVGMAGTGKSYALDAAREAWERAGLRVTGAALSGKAAQGLQEAAHIPSDTLHALLQRLDRGGISLGSRDVLVIDEAGMIGSRQMQRLLAHAHKAGAKVTLVGDHRQLQPVDAGGAFRALVRRLGAPGLGEIRRQREAWARQAVHDFADGNAVTALTAYQARGLLTLSEDRSSAMDRITRDWMRFGITHPERSAIMLAATREETQQLNQAARRQLQAQRRLGSAIRVKTDHGIREFALGDRVLCTRNSRLLGVKNGSLGTVERCADRGLLGAVLHIRLDTGKLTSINARHYGAIEHGYALTTHKAQGITVDQAYVLTGGPMTDRELIYVQMSRHRDSAHIYADRSSIEELLSDAQPTQAMVRYAGDLAKRDGLALPRGYASHFVVCRDFLNAHGEHDIATKKGPPLQELHALAQPMRISRAKDTTQDYPQIAVPEKQGALER